MLVDEKISVRALTAADAGAFKLLRCKGLSEHPSAFCADYEDFAETPIEKIAETLRQPASADDFILGAFAGEQLVAAVGFYRKCGSKLRHAGVIWGLYVDSSARGTGCGRLLMEAAIARVREIDGLVELQLGVVCGNEAASRLYESLGFERYGIMPRCLQLDGVYYDEVLMRLPLD